MSLDYWGVIDRGSPLALTNVALTWSTWSLLLSLLLLLIIGRRYRPLCATTTTTRGQTTNAIRGLLDVLCVV